MKRVLYANGKVMVKDPDHFRPRPNDMHPEHIWILEKELGRPLAQNESVRHLDGNKQNNARENLELVKSGTIRHTPFPKTRETLDALGRPTGSWRALRRWDS